MEENIKNKIYNSQKWKTFLEAAKTRCSDTENNTYKQEFVEFMRKYEEEHKNDLSESLYYYDVATSERFFEECYLLLDSKKIKSILSGIISSNCLIKVPLIPATSVTIAPSLKLFLFSIMKSFIILG